MNKSERDAAIEVEAKEFSMINGSSIDNVTRYKRGYLAGTNSKSNAEYLIRRAVEMARTRGEDHSIDSMVYSLGKDGYYQFKVDQILTKLLKEMK